MRARWMPSVDVVHINPGLFAFMYLLGLPAIAHLGILMAPFGVGRNAPPSNEDIARVAVGVLSDPEPHIGKSYRPTGPELLSSGEIAEILTHVVGRKVKYQDASMKMFSKAAKALDSEIRFCGVAGMVDEVFTISGFKKMFKIFATAAEATAA